MTQTIDLLDDVMAPSMEMRSASEHSSETHEPHDCDGCGATTPDVDVWAESWKTGEQIWLCEACGDW